MAPDAEELAVVALIQNEAVREWCQTVPDDRLFYITTTDGATHKLSRRELKFLLVKLVLLGKIAL